MMDTLLPSRPLGRTGLTVTQVGLGGEGILRTRGRFKEAQDVIHRALDLGITYFDCARVYAGSEEYYGSALGKKRERIFLTSKASERSKKGALGQLHTSLATMRTGYLDLWQVHDIRTARDLSEISAPGGALEACVEARQQGMVRFLGVTAHQDPAILAEALELFDFDTVLMPMSSAHPHFIGFVEKTLPVALRKGMGIIGMKVIGGSIVPARRTPEEVEVLMRYALTLPVSTIVIGCETPREVEMNVRIAREFSPFTPGEMERLAASARSRRMQ
jgi:aryl-alcohol dehydrogenase-like predicted oxidoreductase